MTRRKPRKMDTLATPHDAVVTTSLAIFQNAKVATGEWLVMGSVTGICCDHVLYSDTDGLNAMYAVIPTSGTPVGLRQALETVQDFACYSIPNGDVYPLIHLLTEAAHDQYLAEVG